MLLTTNRLAAIAALLSICSVSSAATIVDFKPLPTSPNLPEFAFTRPIGGPGAPRFHEGPGSVGNADGVLPVPNQTPGGLDAETPFIIPGVPGSVINPVAGTTEFFDATLEFPVGLLANAPAVNAGGVFIQQLSPGAFNLF